ncbi:LCP family protein [Amycolatopsis marina]|uniref:LCP family protein n=1 Tax=Amycolatopsis marina TaxID=490629 RepID=UPI001C4323C3
MTDSDDRDPGAGEDENTGAEHETTADPPEPADSPESSQPDETDETDEVVATGATGTADTQKPEPTPHSRSGVAAPLAPRRRRKGRARRAAVRTLVALLSATALVATGYAYATLDRVQDNVRTTDALIEQDESVAPPQDDGATDILLVGTDARTDMQGHPLPLEVLKELRTESKAGINTDTLILLRIPKDGGEPTGVSIPRDTWVDVPHGGNDKINSAYGVAKAAAAAELRAEGMNDQAEIERESDQAGRRALVRTVQDLTRVRVDHYAEVSLLGFYLLTEALGGVDVCLNQPTEDKDSGADFRAGPQVVSGGEALSFVRQRKNLPRGDLDRIVRQQAFLASALHQVLSAGTLTSPSKLNELVDTVHRSLVLDPDLDLLEFAEQAKGIASGDISFVTIPVVTVGSRSPDGQSIIEVDEAAVRGFVAALAGRDTGTTPTSAPAQGGGSAAGSARAQTEITADGVVCVN